MALTEYEQLVIQTSVFKEIPSSEEQILFPILKNTIRNFNESILNLETPNDSFSMVQKLFNDPSFLFDEIKNEKRPDEIAKPTFGEIREYLIQYADLNFTEHAINLGQDNKSTGWNRVELMKKVRQMPKHNLKIVLKEPEIQANKLPHTPDSSIASHNNILKRLSIPTNLSDSSDDSDNDSIKIERRRRRIKLKPRPNNL